MKKIISASYKDDTPAFFSEEFFNDLKKGFRQITGKLNYKVSLKPEDVYCFVFWTKNCSDHFIEHMKNIKSPFYIQWTITGYDAGIEPEVPNKEEVIRRFQKVSKMIGSKNTIWRYDPILMSDKYTTEYHIEKFEEMATKLERYTDRCVISFFDEYGKIKDEIKKGLMRKPTLDEIHKMAAAFSESAKKHGITMQTCAERGYNLSEYGIHEGPCVDAEYIETLIGESLPEEIKKKNSFRRCDCAVNTDIGSYHRCKHNCLYCYAK